MRAGRMRQRITIQQTTESRTSSGAVTDSWGTYATVWADVIPVSGKEKFAAQEHHSEVTHRFRIRYNSGVTTKMRISYDSRIFNIRSVINLDERNRTTEMIAVEET